ncbi:hypothetical protein [Lentilactobacillus hilgardii]|uniref:hypothetical protein n=1 Tax=Lentilactobacillus hilgardii TaxID=1588 RepID=UPI003FA606B7
MSKWGYVTPSILGMLAIGYNDKLAFDFSDILGFTLIFIGLVIGLAQYWLRKHSPKD